jgi:Tfp pilus assembly protein PilF
MEWYRFGLELEPNHTHILTNLGSVLKDVGKVAEGIESYRRAIAIDPHFSIAIANLANVLKDSGKTVEAICK